jgi:putative membrane protein
MEPLTDCGWMPAMGIGLLFKALFWVALVVATVLVVKWLIGKGGVAREDSVLDILKKRYARGEINKQEFEERKRELLT